MLQLNYIRENKDLVKKRLAVKHFADLDLVDRIIALDAERRKLQADFDAQQAVANAASKEIGMLMGKGLKEEAEAKKSEIALLKNSLQELNEQATAAAQTLDAELVKLPNLPHDTVPNGKLPEDNEVVKSYGVIPELGAVAQPHWELIDDYKLVDFKTGARLAGSGFALFTGLGAKLQRSLVQYFLDHNTAAGYLEVAPPLMVNETTAYGTGQLPDKEGQMYHIPADGLYLIPTSEVPTTNIYADAIVKESELPITLTSYTPCFRREAGSFGADVRGLNRLHQFDKVEIVQLTKAEDSYTTLDKMVAHVEQLLVALELPYRILRLCGGDMSFASALTYDFEVYSAAQKKWLEVSSVSNFESFQTNRMKIRYKKADGKTELLHSLNGSSLALPRIIAALLENNQTTDGILVPKILVPYFGKTIITK
jgi:seryl-tRNA synthetase